MRCAVLAAVVAVFAADWWANGSHHAITYACGVLTGACAVVYWKDRL